MLKIKYLFDEEEDSKLVECYAIITNFGENSVNNNRYLIYESSSYFFQVISQKNIVSESFVLPEKWKFSTSITSGVRTNILFDEAIEFADINKIILLDQEENKRLLTLIGEKYPHSSVGLDLEKTR
jgi:hypothetical protein